MNLYSLMMLLLFKYKNHLIFFFRLKNSVEMSFIPVESPLELLHPAMELINHGGHPLAKFDIFPFG